MHLRIYYMLVDPYWCVCSCILASSYRPIPVRPHPSL